MCLCQQSHVFSYSKSSTSNSEESRYNNICFSCRDREVAGLDTVVPLETTAAYDIKAVISGVCTCITIDM